MRNNLIIFSCLLLLVGCASSRSAGLKNDITKGDLKSLQDLVKRGGNIDEPISDMTPLQWAVENGKQDAVKYLIERNADINATNGGYTPLMLAAVHGNIGIAKLLLLNGANLNAKDRHGNTAFIIARDNWEFSVAKLLSAASDAELQGGKQAVSEVCNNFHADPSLQKYRFENYIDYQRISPKVSYLGNKKVAVTVSDKRPYVLSGETPSEWVGITRGGFGRAYELGNSTLRPIAQEFSRVLTTALADSGLKIVESSNADRILKIEILEWMSVTGGGVLSMTFGTELDYKILVSVLDDKNNILVKQEVNGADRLGGNLAQIYELIPRAAENVFTGILNSSPLRSVMAD